MVGIFYLLIELLRSIHLTKMMGCQSRTTLNIPAALFCQSLQRSSRQATAAASSSSCAKTRKLGLPAAVARAAAAQPTRQLTARAYAPRRQAVATYAPRRQAVAAAGRIVCRSTLREFANTLLPPRAPPHQGSQFALVLFWLSLPGGGGGDGSRLTTAQGTRGTHYRASCMAYM